MAGNVLAVFWWGCCGGVLGCILVVLVLGGVLGCVLGGPSVLAGGVLAVLGVVFWWCWWLCFGWSFGGVLGGGGP